MQIIRNLSVNIDDFFNLLENSLKYEINSCVEQKIDEIKAGFKYSKNMRGRIGKEGKVIITIEQFERPFIYKAKFYSKQGFNYITYNLRKIDDNNTELNYQEEFMSDSKFNNLNYKIVSKVMSKQNKKRANALISSMENHLLNTKRNEETKCQD